MDFGVFLCKMKKRSCLFCFFSLRFTFVELKTTKTSSAVKHFSFSSSFWRKKKFSTPHRRSELMIFDGSYASENIEICIIGNNFFFVAKPTTISLSSVNMKSNGPKEKLWRVYNSSTQKNLHFESLTPGGGLIFSQYSGNVRSGISRTGGFRC